MSKRSDFYILYADDDPDDQQLLIESMASIDSSISIRCQPNGIETFEAIEKLASGDYFPGLIILDMNMPKMDGMSTLKKIKDSPVYRHIPAVIFTSSDFSPHRKAADDLGAVAFLTKPFRTQELKEVCKLFLRLADPGKIKP